MKNPWIIVGAIAVVLFGGAIWFSSRASEDSNVGVTVQSHIKGNENATVTLTEYSDFQCPACASFQPVLNEIMAQYGDKIKFEYKHFPLPIHAYAESAALAAEAAGQQDKFFEYHDVLFAKQTTWTKAAAPASLFVTYAEELGLDVDKFKANQKSGWLKDKVRADVKEGREKSITGTPTFFLNGEKMEFETFQEFITLIATAVDPSFVPPPAATTTDSGADTSSSTAAEPKVKFGI